MTPGYVGADFLALDTGILDEQKLDRDAMKRRKRGLGGALKGIVHLGFNGGERVQGHALLGQPGFEDTDVYRGDTRTFGAQIFFL